MSELCTSFSTLIISDLILSCSSILSHPLYLAYFLFFSPYLLKLVFFLSPLFITTSLLLLAELTQTSLLVTQQSSGFEELQGKNDDHQGLDDLGLYEILFGSSVTMAEERENPVEILEEKSEDLRLVANKVEINPSPVSEMENSSTCGKVEEKRLHNFLKILDEFERMASGVEDKKKADPTIGPKPDKVIVEKPKYAASESINGSEAPKVSENHNSDQRKAIGSKGDHSRPLDRNLAAYSGSMRKEKEWKRTLACKLFEERHNVDGGEGMDSLWEAYEMDSSKGKKSDDSKKKTKKKKKSEIELYKEDEEDDDERINGQLCCLQALNLSARKMNLGVGRPNLVKISKAIKGIGWLHLVSKNSKKVHNNNGDRY